MPWGLFSVILEHPSTDRAELSYSVSISLQNLNFSTACGNAFGGRDCPFFALRKHQQQQQQQQQQPLFVLTFTPSLIKKVTKLNEIIKSKIGVLFARNQKGFSQPLKITLFWSLA